MLYGTRLHPFRIAGQPSFENLPGIFYYYQRDSDTNDSHWLFVEAKNIDEADNIISEAGIWAFPDTSEEGYYLAGIARIVYMQRLAAREKQLDIWDDGFKEERIGE